MILAHVKMRFLFVVGCICFLFFLLVKEGKNGFVPATFGMGNIEYGEDYADYQVRILSNRTKDNEPLTQVL